MVKFSLNSQYLQNLRSVVRKLVTYKEHKCSIVINKAFTLEVPYVVAASTYQFTIKRYNKSSMFKTKQVITTSASVFTGEEDDEEMQAFVEFELSIGNEVFLSPLNKQLDKLKSPITERNVIHILNAKETFDNQGIEKEITFVAENFDSMSTNESFTMHLEHRYC